MSLNLTRISLLTAALSAFSINAQATEHVRPAFTALSEVSGCSFISEIKVSSDYNKHIDWRSHSKHKVLLKAEDMGATHIVIQSMQAIGAFNGIIDANAYQCKG
jgi:hypothetical protein